MTDRKVALVTGAAAGIGASCAQRIANMGMAVGVLDLEEERCTETVAAIESAGGRAIPLGADIADRSQVVAALDKVRGELGSVTVLVNNAGIPGFSPFLEIDDAAWDRMIRINLTGAFVVTQEVLPDMINAGGDALSIYRRWQRRRERRGWRTMQRQRRGWWG
jgi:2-hydroxycyclohexanecarboxyl-CoA dehydrogenase